jgi:hypothetical protein
MTWLRLPDPWFLLPGSPMKVKLLPRVFSECVSVAQICGRVVEGTVWTQARLEQAVASAEQNAGFIYNFSTSRQRPNRAPATGLSNRFSPLTPCRAYSHLRWNGQFLPPIVVYPSRIPAPTSHGPSPSDIPLLPQNSARPIRELPKISQFGCQLPNHTAPFLRCRNFPAVGACWLGPLN